MNGTVTGKTVGTTQYHSTLNGIMSSASITVEDLIADDCGTMVTC
jgi:hypothetical protein